MQRLIPLIAIIVLEIAKAVVAAERRA